jgi:hypothetical protein
LNADELGDEDRASVIEIARQAVVRFVNTPQSEAGS